MNHVLERLVTLKTEATTTRGQLDYVDTLLTDTVHLARRPGDIDRIATYLDELVAEIATARAANATGTGTHRALTPSAATGADLSPEPA